jgi:hypothetical protein
MQLRLKEISFLSLFYRTPVECLCNLFLCGGSAPGGDCRLCTLCRDSKYPYKSFVSLFADYSEIDWRGKQINAWHSSGRCPAPRKLLKKLDQNFSREKSQIFTYKSFWCYLFSKAYVG